MMETVIGVESLNLTGSAAEFYRVFIGSIASKADPDPVIPALAGAAFFIEVYLSWPGPGLARHD